MFLPNENPGVFALGGDEVIIGGCRILIAL
jgi:hypothetical protein